MRMNVWNMLSIKQKRQLLNALQNKYKQQLEINNIGM